MEICPLQTRSSPHSWDILESPAASFILYAHCCLPLDIKTFFLFWCFVLHTTLLSFTKAKVMESTWGRKSRSFFSIPFFLKSSCNRRLNRWSSPFPSVTVFTTAPKLEIVQKVFESLDFLYDRFRSKSQNSRTFAEQSFYSLHNLERRKWVVKGVLHDRNWLLSCSGENYPHT